MLSTSKHQIVTARSVDVDIDTEAEREFLFIACKEKVNWNIIVGKFETSGQLVEIYLADACHTLQEFLDDDNE